MSGNPPDGVVTSLEITVLVVALVRFLITPPRRGFSVASEYVASVLRRGPKRDRECPTLLGKVPPSSPFPEA
ncbi:hypothetical protein Trydic_g3143 [Trypoxylus dichotomus]